MVCRRVAMVTGYGAHVQEPNKRIENDNNMTNKRIENDNNMTNKRIENGNQSHEENTNNRQADTLMANRRAR